MKFFKNFIERINDRIAKWCRQRTYSLIYSERYGYGVEDKLTPTIKRNWFLNHDDIIEEE